MRRPVVRDRQTQDPVSQQVWHDKDLFVRLSAVHRPAMVMSPCVTSNHMYIYKYTCPWRLTVGGSQVFRLVTILA
jgi:hypothetical protein